MYTKLLQTLVNLLNKCATLLSGLVPLTSTYQLPAYPASDVDDSPSQYEASINWLSGSKNDDAARSVSVDLQSHFSLGRSKPEASLGE